MQTPIEDSACSNNCYKTCADIYQEEDLSNTGSDVTLRFFYVKLSEISKYVGKDAKRVFVYAQTILIDESVEFSHSLLIRTKQLFIDRSKVSLFIMEVCHCKYQCWHILPMFWEKSIKSSDMQDIQYFSNRRRARYMLRLFYSLHSKCLRLSSTSL